jgi:hypothetical protein
VSTQQLPTPGAPVRERRVSLGAVIVGLILTVAGLAWFLSALDIRPISFGAALATLLILAGAALTLDLAPSSRGLLTVISLFLVGALMVVSVVDVPLGGGIHDQTVAPATVEQVMPSYSYTAGNQLFDFSGVSFPQGDTAVAVKLGAGNLTITVPADVAVQVAYHVDAGNVTVFGTARSGLSVDGTYTTPGFSTAERRLLLDLRLGAGDIEVQK